MQMTIDNIKLTLPLDSFGNVYLELYDCFLTIDDFINKFNGSTLEYISLYNNPNSTQAWKNQFDEWKGKGILA